jgi:hypothetical protein
VTDERIPAVEETIGQLLMGALYDEITNLRTPWVVTPQQQQQELLDRLRKQVDHAVTVAVKRLATAGFQHTDVQIHSLAVKDEAKVVLLLPRGAQQIHAIADRIGSKAVIVFADPAEYTDGMDQFKAMADQQPLDLE